MGDTANKIQDLLYQQAERLGAELGGLLDSAKETETLRGLLDTYNERVETLRTAVTGNENAKVRLLYRPHLYTCTHANCFPPP